MYVDIFFILKALCTILIAHKWLSAIERNRDTLITMYHYVLTSCSFGTLIQSSNDTICDTLLHSNGFSICWAWSFSALITFLSTEGCLHNYMHWGLTTVTLPAIIIILLIFEVWLIGSNSLADWQWGGDST